MSKFTNSDNYNSNLKSTHTMAFFLSKLKEQASSIQSIAKNMMVYEHADDQEIEDLDGASS